MSWLRSTWRRHALTFVVCVAVCLPIFVVRFPPMQDFPVHVATLRILRDYHDPAAGFDQLYELVLGRTQYVGYYVMAWLVALVTGPIVASRLLVCFYLVGTLLGLRSLLVALDRDERLAFAVVPALYGPVVSLGLLPFLCAFPVMLIGIAALVRRRLVPDAKRHVFVAVVGFVLFYLHVVHLGVFLLAAVILFPWRASNRARLAAAISFAPCGAALVWWLTMTNVGRRMLEATTHWGSGHRAPLDGALLDMSSWIANAYTDATDEVTFGIALAAVGFTSWLAYHHGEQGRIAVRAFWLIPVACLVLYLTGERGRGSIWPIGQRYMLPAVLLAIPLLGMPSARRPRRLATGALLGAGALAVLNVTIHFLEFQRAAADFDRALAELRPNKRVASLMYTRHLHPFRFSPFIHFGSYYQAEKAGVVMFTYAGYDQWPLDFRRGRYPLFDGPAPPRWEFFPERAVEHPLAESFDYVLARGRGDRPAPAGFERTWASGAWEVFAAKR